MSEPELAAEDKKTLGSSVALLGVSEFGEFTEYC